MKVITYYESFDGKRFETEKECLAHEEKVRKENEIIEKAIELRDYCNCHVCNECVFCRTISGDCILGDCPSEWEV